MSENSKLYRVTKIFDKRSEKVVFDTRMCGQAAFVFVPSAATQKVLKEGSKKEIAKYAEETAFHDIWAQQDTMQPVIGYPMYFSSIKMDAGWYRTSKVYEVAASWDKTKFIVQTENSVLLIEEDL
jgi:hypothetical protein